MYMYICFVHMYIFLRTSEHKITYMYMHVCMRIYIYRQTSVYVYRHTYTHASPDVHEQLMVEGVMFKVLGLRLEVLVFRNF